MLLDAQLVPECFLFNIHNMYNQYQSVVYLTSISAHLLGQCPPTERKSLEKRRRQNNMVFTGTNGVIFARKVDERSREIEKDPESHFLIGYFGAAQTHIQ